MASDVPLLLGIDGGGTSCRARICSTDGKILGEGQAGPANVRLGLDQAFGAVLAAAEEALNKAGLGKRTLSELNACLGLAGLNITSAFEEALAHPLPFAKRTLATDTEIACIGAHNGKDGGIVIVGTGSCAEARIKERTLRLGGWGFDLSDQGSGASLGRAALRQSLLTHDGLGPPSTLSGTILAEFDNDPDAMVIWAESAKPSDYARFCPMVFEYARKGDATAIQIVRKSASGVDQLIIGLDRAGAGPIAILGGLADCLRPWLSRETESCLVEPKGTAIDGAILLAHRLLFEDQTDVA